ncbi:uncharacterized protein LOC132563239, partial [Ylistrum balloti]|uniref:uncharacterized protein LOC132563239 n=1 Tax=Ylistrum balloti TaxID=509963 RepID=UPI002905D219
APLLQRPLKKHKAYSAPLKESNRDNQLFLLTQNSPPLPHLKKCSKQSDIKSFFKSPILKNHPEKENVAVRSLFENKISSEGICSDDSYNEDVKENMCIFDEDSYSKLRSNPPNKGENSINSPIQEVIDEDYIVRGDENEYESPENFHRVYKDENSSPSINTKDIMLSSQPEEKERFDKRESELDQEQECSRHKGKRFKKCSNPGISSLEEDITSKGYTCRVCRDTQSEHSVLDCSSYTPQSTQTIQSSHLINSEEADQELENFSLSLNVQY